MKGWNRPLSEQLFSGTQDFLVPSEQIKPHLSPLPIFGQPSRKDPNGNTLSLGSLGGSQG